MFCVFCAAAPGKVRPQALTQAPGSTPAIDNASGQPQHPATEAQIREYLALTGTVRLMREALDKTVAAMRVSAAPYYPASYWDDMQAAFLKIDFEGKLIPIYQEFISTEDMAEAIRFYRSPAGKRILEIQTPATQQSQAVFRKLGGEIGVAVYERHKIEIEAAKQKYEANGSAGLPATDPKK